MKNTLIKSSVHVILCSSMLLFYSCGSDDWQDRRDKQRKTFETEVKPRLVEKYNCDNVDDCISKYQFEGARAYMAAEQNIDLSSENRNLPKITQAEAIYWAKQNEFQRAIDVINEADLVVYKEEEKQNLKFTIYEMAINKYCEDGDFKKAKTFALKASDLHNIAGWSRTQTTDDWKKDETQQKVLLRKIKDYEKAIQN